MENDRMKSTLAGIALLLVTSTVQAHTETTDILFQGILASIYNINLMRSHTHDNQRCMTQSTFKSNLEGMHSALTNIGIDQKTLDEIIGYYQESTLVCSE